MSTTTAIAWLKAAAVTLDARGDHDLAGQARAEAAALAAEPPRCAIRHHCDGCGHVVAGLARLAYYGETLGVDWVLCASCSGPIPSAGINS